MFRNYLVAAIRNLARNKLHAMINIFGLAIAFAAAMLIALFVRHELTYDRFIPGYERVFKLSQIYNPPGAPPMLVDVTLPKLAALLKSDFPEIESIARLQSDTATIRLGDSATSVAIRYVDPDFFKVMPPTVIAGNASASLAAPDGMVLTRSEARRFFGSETVVGRTLVLDNHPMRVGAVIEDWPSNSHLRLTMLISSRASFSGLARLDREGLEIEDLHTYFRLTPGASAERLAAELPAFIKRHGIKQLEVPAGKAALELKVTPISKIHLEPAGLGALKPSTTSKTAMAAFGALATLIVLVAVINYINLMTARAAKRAIEVGVRKAVGALRHELIAQFVGESLLYVGLAALLALGAVELVLPHFNAYADITITFEYWSLKTLVHLLACVAAIGVSAGIYPGFVLSSFRAATVLKGGGMPRQSSGRVRIGLVVLQFSILIGMVLAALTIYRQTRFALQETLRVPADQVIQVWHGCGEAFEDQVFTIAGVQAAACAALNTASSSQVIGRNGESLTFREQRIGHGHLELYGFKPLAGRFFNRAFAADETSASTGTTSNVVINESALRKLGYGRPAEAIGTSIRWQKWNMEATQGAAQNYTMESTIIGVVEDFSLDGMRNKVDPQIFNIDHTPWDFLSIKLDGQHLSESLTAIDRLWTKLHPGQAFSRQFLDQRVQAQYRDVIRQGGLLSALTGLALILACAGLYGLAAFNAEQRTKEVGIRKAMGASITDVMRLLVWQFCKPVLWANLIAWPVAGFVMNRWLQGFAYHIDLSPWLFVAATGLALAIALLTVSVHCYLVARAKPIYALRYE